MPDEGDDAVDADAHLQALRALHEVSKRVHASDEVGDVHASDEVGDVLAETSARLRAVIAEPIVGRTGVRQVTASIGLALGTAADDFSALVAAADAEMYKEKHSGPTPLRRPA